AVPIRSRNRGRQECRPSLVSEVQGGGTLLSLTFHPTGATVRRDRQMILSRCFTGNKAKRM
ncbi:MAG: hypothetical protein KBF76_08995, partial [Verrucomicrobiales bacterium]|nr:hypothetical protein [Verrucomicrobiales bacterium]